MFTEKRLIRSEDIADGEVKTADIGDAQVTTAKIADGAVTPAKTANLGVLWVKTASPTPGQEEPMEQLSPSLHQRTSP
jgi:hypothetical protein